MKANTKEVQTYAITHEAHGAIFVRGVVTTHYELNKQPLCVLQEFLERESIVAINWDKMTQAQVFRTSHSIILQWGGQQGESILIIRNG